MPSKKTPFPRFPILLGFWVILTSPFIFGQDSSPKESSVENRLSQLEKELEQLKKKNSGLSLPNVDSLRLTGDLRLRYEHGERENNNVEQTRHRFRHRLRLGLEWKPTNTWEVAVGLASGPADPTSSNDTWSEGTPFEKGELRIDYAYVIHYLYQIDKKSSLALIAGQQKNPYYHSGFLIWDDSVRPAGLSLDWRWDPWFLTMGGYNVLFKDWGQGSTPMLYIAQTGIKMNLTGKDPSILALAYYHYNDPLDPVPTNRDYEYRILNVCGEVPFALGPLGVRVWGEWNCNLGAEGNSGQGVLGGGIDPESNNQAWMGGICLRWLSWSFTYGYVYIEADSLYRPIKNSDFGGTAGLPLTDVKGYTLQLEYKVSKSFSINGTFYYVDRIDGSTPTNRTDDGRVYQANFVYKF